MPAFLVEPRVFGPGGARGLKTPSSVAVTWFLCALSLTPACVDRLPDQDLRITTATPAGKMPVGDLWKDFQKDPAAARRRYFGKAVDVTGRIVALDKDAAGVPVIVFSEPGQHGVRARLLDERATDTMKDATIGSRIALRCFCQGLTPEQDVLLKSCIKPTP